MSDQTVLIPVEFPDPDPLPSTFIDGLTNCKVILLGVYETPPELTSDERQRREVEAYQVLYTLASNFVREGETAEVELAMGEDVEDAPTTVAEDRNVDAVLVPNPITTLGHVLVAIREEKFAQPITDFLCALNQEVLLHTNLFHVAESESDVEEGERLLSEVKQRLMDEGYSQTGIDEEVVVDTDPSFTISQASRNNDLIIMGETQDSGVERVFGETYRSVAEKTDLPIIVVRDT